MLRLTLQTDEDEDWDGEHHVEDDVRTISVMRFDPSVENKHIDVTHIDFKFGETTSSDRVIFFKHIKKEFELHKWGFEGVPRQMIIKLKQSMMNGMKVRILRDYINRVEENRDTFLFGMELGVP